MIGLVAELRGMEGQGASTLIPASFARRIEMIPYKRARNNHHPSAAPYKIFQRENLRVASEKKWGGI